MKSIIRIFVFGIVFSAFFFVFSTGVSAQLNFDITNYDTHVVISEGNIFKVDEVIQVSFNSQSHGIYRSIPFKGTIYRDTTDSNYAATDYRVAIRNIAVENNKYTVSKSGDYVVIKIGDANTLIDGNQTYHITYDIYMGNDNIPTFDEVLMLRTTPKRL